MTSFEDKERAQETKYALDQEREFKVVARRNKLLGLWVAGQLGYNEEQAKAYAKEVVLSDFEEPGEDDVFRKIIKDLQAAKSGLTEEQLQKKMSELLVEARRQLDSEA